LEGRSVITVINMIKNIIFDVYGTLISTGTGSVDATRIIFEKYNLEDSPVEIYRKWKEIHKKHINKLDEYQSEKEIFIKDLEELFFLYGIKDNPRVRIKPMLDSLYKRQLFEDTESVIKDLSRNYNIAIGSTTDTEPLMHNIRDTYLFTIRNIFTSEYLKCYKPNKKFYSQILQLTNWKPEECVFVGDSMDDDVIGPLKVGMKPILIDRKDRYSEYHDGVKKIKTLLELKQAINE
jgi:HAD superfamily hydrolase (TIGR01549 family)